MLSLSSFSALYPASNSDNTLSLLIKIACNDDGISLSCKLGYSYSLTAVESTNNSIFSKNENTFSCLAFCFVDLLANLTLQPPLVVAHSNY